jgi:hypothetical protein
MKRKAVLTIAAAFALALGVAQLASAQTGEICQLTGSANLSPGLDGSNPQGTSAFSFSGQLSSCQANGMAASNGSFVCSNGSLTNASCSGNQTAGLFAICPSGATCSATPGGPAPKCMVGVNAVAPIASGSFQGACVGASCDGASTNNPPQGIAYSLLFDQATVQRAGSTCPPPPVGAGGKLTTASFSGLLGLGK